MADNRLPRSSRMLTALRGFESAARRSSFKLAAQRLNVTEGAISRHIRNLETELGTTLFLRQHNKVSLTAAGHGLSRALMPAFDMIDDAMRSFADDAERESVVIAAPATFLLRWLIPRLPELEARLGDGGVRFATWDEAADASREDIDIFIGVGTPPGDGALDAMLLGPETFGLVVNPIKLEGAHSPEIKQRLRELVCLVPRTRPHIVDDWLEESGVHLQFKAREHHERLFYALQACEAGHGVTVAPLPLVEDAIRERRLVAPFGFTKRGGAFFAATSNRRRKSPRSTKVLQWLRERFAEPSADEVASSVSE